jgi:hypothetical protein
MKKNVLLLLHTLLLSTTCFAQRENSYTISGTVVQSTIHDALQLYHAKNGLTFYFQPTVAGAESFANYQVYDLYNQKNLGKLTNFAKEFGVKEDEATEKLVELMGSFLKKYNGKQQYIMGQLTASSNDARVAYCDSIWTRILKRNSGRSDKEWWKVYETNNYLKSELTANGPKGLQPAALTSDFVETLAIAKLTTEDLGGAFGPSAKTVGNALASFLIDRANQEINAAVFRRLKVVMTDVEELTVLFPETAELLKTIESYNFDAALNTLRTKLEADVQNLLANIPQLAKLKRYSKLLNTIPELTYFFVTCDLANGLKNHTNPAMVIQKIYSSSYISDQVNNHANVIQLIGFVSFSLRDVMEAEKTSNDRNWINPKLLGYDLASIKEISKYYLGLMVAASPEIVIELSPTNKFNFKNSLNAAEPKISKTYEILNKTFESIRIIQNEIAASNSLQTDEKISVAKYEHYETVLKEVLNIGETFITIPGIPEQQKLIAVINEARNFYIPTVKQVVSITSNIEQKNYNEAVYDIGHLLEIIAQKIKTDTTKKDIDKYFQYGQLLASIAIAKEPEDVKKAIEAVALPSGSSSLKKDAKFNIAINGYIGYFYRDMGSGNFAQGFTQSQGITAPIGFAFSKGMRQWGSLSLFTGVLDVGAIVQYQLKTDPTNSTTTAEPVIEWGNIISPSAQVVYGLPFYIPLSIGVGAQWLPSDASLKNSNYELTSRFNAFLAFDIPIINISSAKKRRK